MTNQNKLNQEKKGDVCEFIHDEGTHLDTNWPPIKVKGEENKYDARIWVYCTYTQVRLV